MMNYGDKFRFLQKTACGTMKEEVDNTLGGEVYAVKEGVVADTCFACENTADPDVKGCKYSVLKAAEEISFSFHTYSSNDCSSGEEGKGDTKVAVQDVCMYDRRMGVSWARRALRRPPR